MPDNDIDHKEEWKKRFTSPKAKEYRWEIKEPQKKQEKEIEGHGNDKYNEDS